MKVSLVDGNVSSIVNELKSCGITRDIQWAKRIHARAVENGCAQNVYVVSALIKAYARCGCMVRARQTFDSVQHPTLVSWNTLLHGYATNGQAQAALGLFWKTKEISGCSADSFTYVAALKACASLAEGGLKEEALKQGKEIHAEVGSRSDMYVRNTLIDVYAKCGSMADAQSVFDSLRNPSVVSWTALLLGYAECGEGEAALAGFSRMKNTPGCAPDALAYVAALKACTSLAERGRKQLALERGREIHFELGCQAHAKLQATLVDMYAKCGSMVDAHRVFDEIRNPDGVSWTALLLGYADNGDGATALEMFSRMVSKPGGCKPDSVTYIAALKACVSLAASGVKGKALEQGREIHRKMGRRQLDVSAQTTLIDMYAKCSSMEDARQVFDSIQDPTVIAWTALILGYVENAEGSTALDLFLRMKNTVGCIPDAFAYIAALKACAAIAAAGDKEQALRWGREIHSEAAACHHHPKLAATVIDMYCKCGSTVDARNAFVAAHNRDVASWNALLFGYAENGDARAALELLTRMKSEPGCDPDALTYVAALKACASLAADGNKEAALQRGREIHSEAVLHEDGPYVRSALIDMYSKCESMPEARQVFDSVHNPGLVSWNALLLGYAENGEEGAALELFARLKNTPERHPDAVTYLAVLKACSSIGALSLGRKLHTEMEEVTPHLVACLVGFYAKCGSIGEACEVFDAEPRTRELSTVNALLAGYARFGDTGFVLNLFEAQRDAGMQPDAVTFVCLLACCSHAGLVDKATGYLQAMPLQYGIPPAVAHYNCMVDVLGRANQLSEAVAAVRAMPCPADAITWMTLLSACRKWKNAEIGSWAFQRLVEIDKKNAPGYVVMAQIYGSCGMWKEQERVLEMKISCS